VAIRSSSSSSWPVTAAPAIRAVGVERGSSLGGLGAFPELSKINAESRRSGADDVSTPRKQIFGIEGI
jgi:hypothetical protein